MAQAWFRFYSETLHDRKIERICRQTGEPKAVVVGAWAILLALANDSPVRGALLLTENVPLTTGDIMDEMGLPPDGADRLLRCFCDLDMIHQDEGTWYVTHFGDRQYDSDNSTERVQRYRERHKVTNPDSDKAVVETPVQRFRNTPDTETDTETDTEAEADNDNAAIAAPPPQPARRGNGKPPKDPAPQPAKGEFAHTFLELFGALRFKNAVQLQTVLALERDYGQDRVLEAAKWAAVKGMRVGDAIGAISVALPTWGKQKQPMRAGQSPPEPKAWAGIRAAMEEYQQEQGDANGKL